MCELNDIDYEFVFENAPAGMCISKNGVIKTCNDALVRMFGYQRHAMLGKSFYLLHPTDDEFSYFDGNISSIVNDIGFYSGERIMKRSNGELFWCRLSGSASDGDDPYTIWIFEDMGKRRTVATGLTAREREICSLLLDGKTSKLIARQIGLSPRTIEKDRSRIMRKLSVANFTELMQRLQHFEEA